MRMVGPMSKRKSGLAELGGLAAEPGILLEDLDAMAARGEGAGGGEAGETGADDADAARAFSPVAVLFARRLRTGLDGVMRFKVSKPNSLRAAKVTSEGAPSATAAQAGAEWVAAMMPSKSRACGADVGS